MSVQLLFSKNIKFCLYLSGIYKLFSKYFCKVKKVVDLLFQISDYFVWVKQK